VPPVVSIGLLSAAALFCCVLMGVPSVHLVAFANGEGLDPTSAARAGDGADADGRRRPDRDRRHRRPDRTAGRLWLLSAGADRRGRAVRAGGRTRTALVLVAAIYGFGFGGVMTALVCAVRAAVPAGSVGSAMALVGLLAWLGMGAGGYQAGLCFDRPAATTCPS
jgi:hypothetical protein